jgi:3-hydroxyisobutyrate dehydrogenase
MTTSPPSTVRAASPSAGSPSTPQVVGVIGLGSMGSGMAANLARAGYALRLYDVRPDAAVPLLSETAEWRDTPARVAADCDVVITMLPTPRHVEAVAAGPDGILAGIRDGGTWIDMSTSVPEVLDGIRGEHAGRGLRLLDAPVSGMATGAAAGTLQIFVGGETDDYARVLPLLHAMGDPERVMHVGPHGAGYAVKLMINQLWFSHLVATAEVLSVGTKAGVDLGVLREALIASPARSNFLESDVLSILHHGDYDEGFALALACKDLGLSIDLGRAVNIPMTLSAVVEQIYRLARSTYGDAAGEMSPVQLYEGWLGEHLRLGQPATG